MAQIILAPQKARRVENGHPWVYDNEVHQINGKYQNGDIVEVLNHKKQFIGKGYINNKSHILVRLLTRNPKENIDKQFFYKRIQEAIQYRQLQGFTDTYRVVFGEADFLPALVVDKFGDVVVLQALSFGMDTFKPIITEVLQELLQPKAIYERNDVPVRELEGLTQQTGFLTAPIDLSQGVVIKENGFSFNIDVLEGQKTGYFLDQTANRAAIAPFVKDKTVLDCFCHTGSFAVHAAGYGAKQVTALDISEHAILSAKKNAALNNLTNIEFVTANAFDALKEWTAEKRQFDTVILDPPAFTKSRQTINNALRGYKEINLRGMKLVKKGGFLITCTCSHFVTPELFRKTLQEAAQDAGVFIREVTFMPQGKDHPILWNVEETLYLKFYILQVL
ncbi:MAG: class I SAM-dependent rRNA methyltransferase [Thermoflexibacteraceae bacterium]